jgi:hypothetical protein
VKVTFQENPLSTTAHESHLYKHSLTFSTLDFPPNLPQPTCDFNIPLFQLAQFKNAEFANTCSFKKMLGNVNNLAFTGSLHVKALVAMPWLL